MKVSLISLGLCVAGSALASPRFQSAFENDMPSSASRGDDESIIGRLRQDKDYSRFVSAIENDKKLRSDLERTETVATVFAPTNAAIKKFEDRWGKESGGKVDWSRILEYSVAQNSRLDCKDMQGGMLIPSSLRLRSLDDKKQQIRVFKFADSVWLNGESRIERKIEAGKGVVYGIDHVLSPPMMVSEALGVMANRFSTFLLALDRTGLRDKVDTHRGVTVFAPSNSHWETLGLENLKHLFSCAGQQTEEDDDRRPTCQGVKDLKYIVQNHIATDLAYARDMAKKEKMTLRTLGNMDIKVCAKPKAGRRQTSSDRDDVTDFNFIVNDGEARVMFTDGLAANGAVQVVDNVLVGDFRLPHDRIGQ